MPQISCRVGGCAREFTANRTRAGTRVTAKAATVHQRGKSATCPIAVGILSAKRMRSPTSKTNDRTRRTRFETDDRSPDTVSILSTDTSPPAEGGYRPPPHADRDRSWYVPGDPPAGTSPEYAGCSRQPLASLSL